MFSTPLTIQDPHYQSLLGKTTTLRICAESSPEFKQIKDAIRKELIILDPAIRNAMLKIHNQVGCNVLYEFLWNSDILKIVLGAIAHERKLIYGLISEIRNGFIGGNILSMAIDKPAILKILLEILPLKDRLEVLMPDVLETPLELAKQYPDSLAVILDALFGHKAQLIGIYQVINEQLTTITDADEKWRWGNRLERWIGLNFITTEVCQFSYPNDQLGFFPGYQHRAKSRPTSPQTESILGYEHQLSALELQNIAYVILSQHYPERLPKRESRECRKFSWDL